MSARQRTTLGQGSRLPIVGIRSAEFVHGKVATSAML